MKTLAVVLLGSLALSGCGGLSKKEIKQRLVELQGYVTDEKIDTYCSEAKANAHAVQFGIDSLILQMDGKDAGK